MALDGAFLTQLGHEILTVGRDARIDRIAQPFRDDIIIHLRWPGGKESLLLSANASNPRAHFTRSIPENPQSPPMFCMLLRKHLSGARLVNVRQQGMDRILFLDFEALNEFGDVVTLTLVHEIMGRHSNIILVDEDDMILDAIKRVSFETSSVRQLLPNIRYHLPPAQDKINMLEHSAEEIIQRVQAADTTVSRGIMNTAEGMSPLPSRELAFRAFGEDLPISTLQVEQWRQLEREIADFQKLLREHQGVPTMLLEEDGHPRDFTFFEMTQYAESLHSETHASYSELLDAFYRKRHTTERMRQLSSNLLRQTKNIYDRITRRIAAQQEELLATQDRDQLRIIGDILTANIYALKQGLHEAELENFYEEGEPITIVLDPQLSPAENAQAYYSRYRKADTAEKVLTKRIASGQQEQEYIAAVLDSIQRAENASELEPIREELVESGYLKKRGKGRRSRPAKVAPLEYQSSDGFVILAGRNNKQNEQLTLRSSQKHDIWLHTQNIPGSHVVIVTQQQPVPQTTLEQAAMIAAYHSQAQDSTNVPVDYTEIRHVRKQSGGRPGMVLYEEFSTLFVTPSEAQVESMQKL